LAGFTVVRVAHTFAAATAKIVVGASCIGFAHAHAIFDLAHALTRMIAGSSASGRLGACTVTLGLHFGVMFHGFPFQLRNFKRYNVLSINDAISSMIF
jgi:hypothetical protein